MPASLSAPSRMAARLAALVFLVALAAALPGCVTVTPAPVPPGSPAALDATCEGPTAAETAALVAATNEARIARGLAKVRPSAALSRAAAAHSCDMAARGRMTHDGSTTSGPGARLTAQGYGWSVVAENIAAGPKWDAAQVLAQWNRSDKHLDNILLPQAREVGIGGAFTEDGMGYWTAIYAAPR